MYSEEVKELLAELNLQVNLDDPVSSRAAILALIASLHPDKTGGSFADEAQKEKLDRALKLRDLFDRELSASTQMVPIQHMASLIEAIAKAQALTQVKDHPSQPTAQEQFRRGLKRKYAFPKITSALIATICFTLFSFLGNFRNSPFYRLAIDAFAKGNKIEIIEQINSEGERIKKDVANALHLNDERPVDLRELQGTEYINEDEWPQVVSLRDKEKTNSWLELNTKITDVDLHSSDDEALFKPLEKMNTQLEKAVSPGVNALISELKKRPGGKQAMPETERDFRGLHERERLRSYYTSLTHIQRVARSSNQNISDLREQLPKSKKRALNIAERDILVTLAIVTVLAGSAFAVTWLRERSDQRWVEFVSSDEGLELVFSRLCSDKEIASRTPPIFQQSEFIHVLARKDVPQYLVPVLGEHLEDKELNQIASSLITRLKEYKVITQVKAPTIQPLFEITADYFKDARDQHPAVGKKHRQ